VCAAACASGRAQPRLRRPQLTLAAGGPAAANLGGDANTAAALAIMSGIVGVLVGNRMLRWMGIPEGEWEGGEREGGPVCLSVIFPVEMANCDWLTYLSYTVIMLPAADPWRQLSP